MFKRRYLKIENLYFIQLHIRINQNFVPFVGALAKITIIVKNGTKTSRITLCSISVLPAYLNLRKQRFLCRECGSSFTADTSRIVEKYCHISKRLNHYIIYLSICVLMNLNLLNLPIAT